MPDINNEAKQVLSHIQQYLNQEKDLFGETLLKPLMLADEHRYPRMLSRQRNRTIKETVYLLVRSRTYQRFISALISA